MASTAATSLDYMHHEGMTMVRARRIWLVALGALFLAVHWSFVSRMVHIATNTKVGLGPWATLKHMAQESWNPDWSHIMLVPLISFYFVMRSRKQLATITRRIFPPGLAIMVVGLLSFVWWVFPGKNPMFQGLSMVVTLFGLVLFLMGPARMRLLWFPIVYLVLFVRISPRIWNLLALKLQGIAAASATALLKVCTLFIDFNVDSNGNTIEIGFMRDGLPVEAPLTIAEACSGLRMLMAFVALGVAMAFLTDRVWWQRLIMVVMAVPIAVAINVGRVTMLGLLTMVDPEMTRGDFHTMLGMFMLIPAAGMFWLLGWVIDKLLIHEPQPVSAAAVGTDVPPQTLPSAAPRHLWRQLFDSGTGIAIGIALATLVGLNYYLFFILFQPGNVQLQRGTIGWLLTGVAAALLVCSYYVYRLLTQRSGKPHRQGQANQSKYQLMLPSPKTTIALGIVAGILVTALAGFSAMIRFNKLVLFKEALELRQPLFTLNNRVGSWQVIHKDDALSADVLEVLGTLDYISWVYANKAKRGSGGGVGDQVRLHVAYYSGTIETIGHTPDKCIVASGGISDAQTRVYLTLQGPQYRKTDYGYSAPSLRQPEGVTIPQLRIPATLFQYHLPEAPNQIHSAIFFFAANGRFLPNPHQVRINGFLPWDKYSYYCKIELGLSGVSDPDVAVQKASQFLSTMLPEIMAALPDWYEINNDYDAYKSKLQRK